MWIPFVSLALLMSTAFAEKVAIVYLNDPTGLNQVSGTVTFNQTDHGITVVGKITGLTPGNHGFHIHNLGKIFPDCMESGGHFNPENNTHGAPNDTVRHVGDLGNIIALNDGSANIDILDTVIALEGNHGIIGRALVVHEYEDDLGKGGNETSLTTGNAGGRMACGVIGILMDEPSSSTIFTASFAVNIIVLLSSYGLRSVLSF